LDGMWVREDDEGLKLELGDLGARSRRLEGLNLGLKTDKDVVKWHKAMYSSVEWRVCSKDNNGDEYRYR